MKVSYYLMSCGEIPVLGRPGTYKVRLWVPETGKWEVVSRARRPSVSRSSAR